MSELLREAELAHAVVDLDDLSLVLPTVIADLAEIRDFAVSTDGRSIARSASEVIAKAGWDQTLTSSASE